MDLLEKFCAVTIEADNRISPADKDFCEKHQAAYEAAINAFHELEFFWEDMCSEQEALLGGTRGSKGDYTKYLSSRDNILLSADKINTHIEHLHGEFISTLVYHFNSTYRVTASCEAVKGTLLPKKPNRYSDEAQQSYHEQMQTVKVRYQDVIDQIVLQLDGRTFAEQAFYELADKCHKAAWNTYQMKAEYERVKNVIRFTGYCCKFQTWGGRGEWELQDDMKTILTGAAHFETGSYHLFPYGFSELLSYRGVSDSVHEFPTCEKLLQLKMYKNSRVDIKFSSDAYAKEFAQKYLETVCR